MSTRSTITLKNKEGKFETVYCHFDGYIESGVGEMLIKFYPTEDKLKKLLELGDLSILAQSIECPDGHSYGNRVHGYTVAYGRDRGETGTTKTINHSFRSCEKEVYNYLFQDGKWFVNYTENDNLTELSTFFK